MLHSLFCFEGFIFVISAGIVCFCAFTIPLLLSCIYNIAYGYTTYFKPKGPTITNPGEEKQKLRLSDNFLNVTTFLFTGRIRTRDPLYKIQYMLGCVLLPSTAYICNFMLTKYYVESCNNRLGREDFSCKYFQNFVELRFVNSDVILFCVTCKLCTLCPLLCSWHSNWPLYKSLVYNVVVCLCWHQSKCCSYLFFVKLLIFYELILLEKQIISRKINHSDIDYKTLSTIRYDRILSGLRVWKKATASGR